MTDFDIKNNQSTSLEDIDFKDLGLDSDSESDVESEPKSILERPEIIKHDDGMLIDGVLYKEGEEVVIPLKPYFVKPRRGPERSVISDNRVIPDVNPDDDDPEAADIDYAEDGELELEELVGEFDRRQDEGDDVYENTGENIDTGRFKLPPGSMRQRLEKTLIFQEKNVPLYINDDGLLEKAKAFGIPQTEKRLVIKEGVQKVRDLPLAHSEIMEAKYRVVKYKFTPKDVKTGNVIGEEKTVYRLQLVSGDKTSIIETPDVFPKRALEPRKEKPHERIKVPITSSQRLYFVNKLFDDMKNDSHYISYDRKLLRTFKQINWEELNKKMVPENEYINSKFNEWIRRTYINININDLPEFDFLKVVNTPDYDELYINETNPEKLISRLTDEYGIELFAIDGKDLIEKIQQKEEIDGLSSVILTGLRNTVVTTRNMPYFIRDAVSYYINNLPDVKDMKNTWLRNNYDFINLSPKQVDIMYDVFERTELENVKRLYNKHKKDVKDNRYRFEALLSRLSIETYDTYLESEFERFKKDQPDLSFDEFKEQYEKSLEDNFKKFKEMKSSPIDWDSIGIVPIRYIDYFENQYQKWKLTQEDAIEDENLSRKNFDEKYGNSLQDMYEKYAKHLDYNNEKYNFFISIASNENLYKPKLSNKGKELRSQVEKLERKIYENNSDIRDYIIEFSKIHIYFSPYTRIPGHAKYLNKKINSGVVKVENLLELGVYRSFPEFYANNDLSDKMYDYGLELFDKQLSFLQSKYFTNEESDIGLYDADPWVKFGLINSVDTESNVVVCYSDGEFSALNIDDIKKSIKEAGEEEPVNPITGKPYDKQELKRFMKIYG